MYLVVEWVTMSAPHSKGRQLIGVANVLSMMYSATRIGDGLAKQRFSVRTESLLDLFLTGLWRYKGTLDAEFLQGYAEEVVGTTIDLVGCYKVVAALADIEESIEVGGLT